MNVSIIGSGYVGLITGLCFAKKGHNVIFFDIDKDKISNLKRGKPFFFENGLDELMESAKDRVSFTDNADDAILGSELSFVCVGTPFDGNKINLEYIKSASVLIGSVLKKKTAYHTVVIKSTVIPETTKDVVLPILEKESGKEASDQFGLCMNPEFLREGAAINDALEPDRIVIGSNGSKEGLILKEFYEVQFPGVSIVMTNLSTAEMIKYANNAFFPLLISFSNELANMCVQVKDDIDVNVVLDGVCLDRRVNPYMGGKRVNPGIISYLKAGCGFGGSCFPKDLKAITSYSKSRGYDPSLLRSILAINEEQMEHFMNRVGDAIGDVKGKTVCVLGLSFKPDTDDIRESPSLRLISDLLAKGADVNAHDPKAMDNVKRFFNGEKGIKFCTSAKDALNGASACFVVTSWDEYRSLKQEDFKSRMEIPVLVDCRRIFDHDDFKDSYYIGAGIKDKKGGK